MNWSFRIEQRSRIAIALGVVFFLIILAYWFVGYTMNQVSAQFKSVYHDRLVPALDISAIQERYYQNRLLLEEHILADKPELMGKQKARMLANNSAIDSILTKFKATKLTVQEDSDLQHFILASSRLDNVQATIIAHSSEGKKEAATVLYNTQGRDAFLKVLEPLHALSHLQQEVGHDLYASAERQVKTLQILSYLVIGLAIIIALLIGTLLQANRKIKNIKPQQFHWD